MCFCYEGVLKIHIESAHSMISCDECGLEFKKDNIRMHKHWAHDGKLREVANASSDTDSKATNDQDIEVKPAEESVSNAVLQVVQHIQKTYDSK